MQRRLVTTGWTNRLNLWFQVKIPDPEFDCVAENLLETWQKGNQTFKKVIFVLVVDHLHHCLDHDLRLGLRWSSSLSWSWSSSLTWSWSLAWSANQFSFPLFQVEYTMQLQVDGKTYLAASNTKKAAKQACASEAWNAIRATLLWINLIKNFLVVFVLFSRL